jgi:hypothetical protein
MFKIIFNIKYNKTMLKISDIFIITSNYSNIYIYKSTKKGEYDLLPVMDSII